MTAVDRRLVDGRRAFPKAQELLAGYPVEQPRRLVVGWHDSGLDPEQGAFALVARGGANDDLVGAAAQVVFGHLGVFVYVVDAAEIPAGWDLSLARRAYWALARLSIERIVCQVAVCGGSRVLPLTIDGMRIAPMDDLRAAGMVVS